MRIGILYICIGQYDFFWKDFYLSAEKYFFQGYPWVREYYVFTDHPSIFGEEENKHIHRIYQEDLGWPDNTMLRFRMFLSIGKQLRESTDYLFFFNANMQFLVPVGEEILPTKKDNDLVGVKHSYFYTMTRWNYTYERRFTSSTYVPWWKGTAYFQGSLWGGTTDAVLSLCNTCLEWILKDKAKKLIPRWHDESAVNRYFIEYPPKILDCGYNYAEEIELPFEKKILLKDKSNYFSLSQLSKSYPKDNCFISWYIHFTAAILNRLFGRYKK